MFPLRGFPYTPFVFPGTDEGHCRLRLVNFEAHENQTSHETQGLSKKHLVVRRGKPFKVTLLFGSRSWSRYTERLVLKVWLGIKHGFGQDCVISEEKVTQSYRRNVH